MEKRGKIRLCILGVVLLFISFSFYFASVRGDSNWIIEGDKVYVDDNNVYISAQPHTFRASGYVYFNLTSKVYSGDIDVVWGFNTSEVKPTLAQLYKPEWKNRTESYTCPTNFFNYTLNPKYAWCYENVTTYNLNVSNGSYLRLIYEHSFEWENLPLKTIYWNESYLIEWKDYSSTFSSINYEYGGMNKWYYIKNIPIQKDKSYYFRGYVDIPVKLGSNSGKYWFAIKPSSETIQEAIINNHLYALDPWWNSTWNYKRAITFAGDIKQNWTQEIEFAKPANMNETCKDIRFLDATETYELGHRNVVCNATNVIEHVRIDNNNSIYLYYGNNAANTTSKWRSAYLCGDDWEDNLYPNITIPYGTVSIANGKLNVTSDATSKQWWKCGNLIT